MEPKVSIVVPVYNTERFIERCINSVLNQSYSNVELVLINDGSTDKSKIICDKYAKEYSSIIFYSQSNQGVSKARNKGVELSTGDFVFFLDSDDELDLTAVEKCIKVIENEDCDTVLVWRSHKKTPTNNENYNVLTMSGEEACLLALQDKMGGIIGALHKRDIVFRTPLKDYCYSEDTSICYRRFYLSRKVCYLEQYLYYVIGDNSDSLTRSMPNYKKRFDSLRVYKERQEFILDKFPDNDVINFNIKNIIISALSLITTLYFIYNSKDILALKEYQEAKNSINQYRNCTEAVNQLGLKYRILLYSFGKNNIHMYYAKGSYFLKKLKRKL